jgi:hypothetical protein
VRQGHLSVFYGGFTLRNEGAAERFGLIQHVELVRV